MNLLEFMKNKLDYKAAPSITFSYNCGRPNKKDYSLSPCTLPPVSFYPPTTTCYEMQLRAPVIEHET